MRQSFSFPKLSRWVSGPAALLAGLLGGCILWAYWPVLVEVVVRWEHDPRYSHGYLVPAFSAFLLWSNRGRLEGVGLAPCWWGLPVLGAGAALYVAGGCYCLKSIEGVSLLVVLAGAVTLVAGWGALSWAWRSVAFLVFMLPLPYRVEVRMAGLLQRVATAASTYALQTLGVPALSEGNTIEFNDTRLEVIEACGGLGMVFTFVALAVGVALVIRRSRVDKLAVVASAVPIALVANITRITVTGVLHETVGGKLADEVFHDLAGWLMMPLALAILYAELVVLSSLIRERGPAPAGAGMLGGPAASPPPWPGTRF